MVTYLQHPTTSQASIIGFQQAIQDAIHQGAKEAIILTLSSALSGTYRMAQIAAETADIPVSVVDSKGFSLTLGWQVLVAAHAREIGKNIKGILSQVDQVRNKLALYIAMETLEYLQKGGRIGDAIKWMSTLLHVKPLVSVNN